MNSSNSVVLPPIKHLFKSLFDDNNKTVVAKQSYCSPSFEYDPVTEAAHSLQQLSSAIPYEQQPRRAHRRTVSASFDQQQTVYFQPKRARAHTTSGYPPTTINKPSNPHRYHCPHCNKSFSRPSSLRIHIYSHTGEKPFKCQYPGCGRSFNVHSNMRRHLNVHYCNKQPNQIQQNNKSMRLPIVPSSTPM